MHVISLGQPANTISEYDEIYNWSNPMIVQKKAKQMLGKDVIVYRSTRKDKKYMVYDPYTGKMIHFGQLYAKDFTITKDIEKQRLFKLRNHKWALQYKFTPAWLSYHLLW
jgi:hypothetical protein